jgi:hypothetical protein
MSKDSVFQNILEKIGCKPAVHKASRDIRQIPGMNIIVVACMLKENLASDSNNINVLMFGDVARVRCMLLSVGPDIC